MSAENQVANYNNSFYNNYQGVQPVVGAQVSDLQLNEQHPTVSSIYINGEIELYFEAIGAQLAALCADNEGPNHYIEILNKYIIFHPYVVMVNPEAYQGFLSFLGQCNNQVLNGILEKMTEFPDDFLVAVSCHRFGSEVIKELIFLARRLPCVNMFPRVFATRIVVMITKQTGSRVILACLHSLDKLKNEPLYEEVVRNCLEIANSKYGCIAIQHCIDTMDPSPSQPYCGQDSSPKEQLLEIISNHAATLAKNCYGTFVLQFLIRRYPKDCLESIAVGLKPLYERLCTNKNGSYLVEKILSTSFVTLVADALLESNNLVTIAQDAFGNYAIQTLLMKIKEHKAEDHYHKLRGKLSQDLSTLESSLFGKKVAYLIKDELKNNTRDGIRKKSKKVTKKRSRHNFPRGKVAI